MAAGEGERDVLRLRGVQNVLVLGHDELVDDPALPVVDGHLVGRDGAGRCRGGGLLQLRGARRRARAAGRAREDASPPGASSSVRCSHASRGRGGARRHPGLGLPACLPEVAGAHGGGGAGAAKSQGQVSAGIPLPWLARSG